MDGWMNDLMGVQQARLNKNTFSYADGYGFYRKAFHLSAADKKDMEKMLQFSPGIANRMLYRTSKFNSDYEEDNYLDVFIFQTGKKLNKKIIGLEDYKATEKLFYKYQKEELQDYSEKENEELREQKRLRLKELNDKTSYHDMLEEAYRFFSSIRFADEPETKSTVFTSAFGYSIEIPAGKSVVTPYPGKNLLQQEVVTALHQQTGNYFMAMSASLYDFNYIEEDTFELNILAERFCIDADKKITSRNFARIEGNPAIKFRAVPKGETGSACTGQIIIAGTDYYLLCASADSATTAAFFHSFRILPKSYTIPFVTVKDTILLFSASMQKKKRVFCPAQGSEQRSLWKKRKGLQGKKILPTEKGKTILRFARNQ